MNNWIYFFITRPITTVALYAFLFIAGIGSMIAIPIESEPEVAKNEIYVSVNYSSSLDAVLNAVAIPLEKKLLSIPGVDLLKADVTNNNIQFMITFAQDSDMNSNMIKVQSAISDARSEIPENAIVTVPPVKENSTKIMCITFSSEDKSIEEVSNFVNKFKSVFETTEGVAAAVIGNDTSGDVCNIMLRPADMNARNLSFHDITENLKSFYVQGGSSDITVGNNNIALEIGYEENQDLLRHPISSQNNSSVYLYEIAEIVKGGLDKNKNYSYRLNGNEIITLIIYKKQDANLISVCHRIKDKFQKIQETCIQNKIQVKITQDSSIFVNNGIQSIYHTILESVVLVSVIIFMFLRSIVLSIIPIIAIPLSIIPTFCLMHIFHVSINVFSLFGIVIAIGLVVDDAIVVIENIHRYMHHGAKKLDAAVQGTSQIILSIISMTITLAIVYLPILFTSDPYIKAFFDFAFVISSSVIISGIISITITPMLFNLLYNESHSSNIPKQSFMQTIERGYLNLLCYLISNRYIILYIFTTAAFATIIVLLKIIKYEEEISVDRGSITYQYNYKTDNNLDIKYIDDKLLSFYNTISKLPIAEDIDNVITSVSQNDTSVNYISITLKEHKYRQYNIKEITDQIQAAIEQNPTDLVIYNIQGGGQELVVKVNVQMYEDMDFRNLTHMVGGFEPIRNIIQDFFTVDVRPHNCYLLTINKDLCKLYGVMPHTICDALTSIKKGKYFRESASNSINKISFGIHCNHSDEQLQRILDIPIKGYVRENDQMIHKIYTLKTFAGVKTKTQMSKYHRISGNQGMTFTMILKPGRSIRDMQKAIEAFNKCHGGSAYAEINIAEIRRLASMNMVIKLTMLSVIFIYLLLAALFESLIKPIIILSIVPASSAGGLIALYITGLKINTVSIIGMITLIGLITKHGIMLIDYASRHEGNVKEPDSLILDACLNRFRPILMTTACMILGAIPLIIKTHVELIEYKLPIAMIIIGGTAVGTLITLLILPIYYVIVQEAIFGQQLMPEHKYIYIVNNKLREHHNIEKQK